MFAAFFSFFFSTIYKINWLYISVACVIKCDQSVLRSVRKCVERVAMYLCVCVCACAGAQGFVGLYEGAVWQPQRFAVQPVYGDVCERAGLHAREPGQLWFHRVTWFAEIAAVRRPDSIVGSRRRSRFFSSSFECVLLSVILSFVQLWTVSLLGENTNFTAPRPSKNRRRGFCV